MEFVVLIVIGFFFWIIIKDSIQKSISEKVVEGLNDEGLNIRYSII